MGVRIPSWVSSLTNLVHFGLNKNRRLQHLPLLNQLPFLKFVTLVEMEALEYIWIDEESVSNVLGASSSSSSSSKTSFFPSLSSLEIRYCLKVKGWWRNLDDDDNEPRHLLLPSLSELVIEKCPNLTYMPAFPYLKERLELSGCSWKVLEQTMKMKMGAATTPTYFPLSQLQKLQLDQISNFDSLPEEGLRNLISLQELYIQSCDGLVSLPWIGILTSLQTLKIMRCPNLTSLPQEIRNLTSLKELYISGSPNLTSIPQEIRNLTFLKELYISGCPNLTTLPQEIRNLPLIELTISGCPLLGQRCKRQIGEDWPFIAHVPFVFVDG
ncbi:putative disease resistance protein RGA4 [Quercus lobata]|uniref:putative disease resistance protein RGA4 n=1 Tax=Quercus lobata TaxID=97700 RepID=UPI001245DB55|nr:putative disease resistance protein RGA4 [Quercus lobata]